MGGKSKYLLMLRIGILLSLIMAILCISNRPIQTVYAVPDIFNPSIHDAEDVTYSGQKATQLSYKNGWSGTIGKAQWVTYNNTDYDENCYVVFSKAITNNGIDYDIVIYPWKGTTNRDIIVGINEKNLGDIPLFGILGNGNKISGHACYKLYITESGNMNNHVNMDILIGVSDLDTGEYIVYPNDFRLIFKGSHVNVDNQFEGIRYRGSQDETTDKGVYCNGAVVGALNVPETGVILKYGHNTTDETIQSGFAGAIVADEILNNTYALIFDANGGTGTLPDNIVEAGTATSTVMGDIGGAKPSRSGYVFKGWSSTESFNDKRIAYNITGIDGATQTSSTWTYADYCTNTNGDSSKRQLVLYAQWELITYNVTYDGNGSDGGSTANQTKTHDQSLTLQSNGFTKTGHHFTGWNTAANGTGTSYAAGGTYTSNSDVTLYAQWEIDTYPVTYNGNGNDGGSTSNQTKTYGQDLTLQSNGYTKTGYHFTGWNTAANGTGTSYAASSTYNGNAALTLYAQWEIDTYEITYDGNGSDGGSTSNQTKTYNINISISSNGYTKTGYIFTNWNTAANGTGTSYNPGDTYSTNGPLTLYAQWRPITYKLQFHSNDTSILDYNSTDVVNQTVTNSSGAETTTITYNQTFTLKDNPFRRGSGLTTSNNEKLNEGYNFVGWGRSTSQSTPDYTNGQSVKNLTSTDGATVHLYAIWSKEIKIEFNMNGGEYNGDASPVTLKSQVYNGTYRYPFKLDNTETDASLPNYEKQIGTIDAYGEQDDTSNGLNKVYTKTVNGVRYRFLGWATDQSASEPIWDLCVFNNSRSTTFETYNNTTLYAVWESALQVSLTLDRSLGRLQFSNGTSTKPTVKSLTATNSVGANVSTIIRPGEEGYYQIVTYNTSINVEVNFDNIVTSIYDTPGIYTDNLNPSTAEDLIKDPVQSHGLNRKFTTSDNANNTGAVRKFHMPQYIGTATHAPSKNQTQYHVTFKISQPSYYYRIVKGEDETIYVNGLIYISTNKHGKPESIINDLKTNIRQ